MAKRVKVEVDGYVYPSAAEAWRAEAVPGLNYTTFMERMYAGWEAWRALRVKPQNDWKEKTHGEDAILG